MSTVRLGSICVAESPAESDFVGEEARALIGMWMLPHVYDRSTIANDTALLTPVERYI